MKRRAIYELLPDIYGEFVPSLRTRLSVNLNEGKRVDPSSFGGPVQFVTGHTRERPPTAFMGWGNRLMSDAFIEVLTTAGVTNLQTFPAVIKNTAAKVAWKEFKLINVVGAVY